ncbi:dimerization domain protein, hAT family [Ancylostoma caninum]|uniref:Dimerization domain protein, hAT family n=1 Tax=Ancylostoma caninum TaxID=29170 RepID=A0A368GLS7_ANCCA|nr:dimerization domain protein, hAT family [Ancylostoma caninum]
MKRTMTLLNIISVDCFAHKLQLAVKDGLSKLGTVENGADSLLSRLTKIVRKLKKSRLDKENFTACQHLCELSDNTLIKRLQEESSRLGNIKEVIARSLMKRMTECEEREEYYIATYVDPRFKDAYCANKRDAFLLKVEQTAYEVYGGGEGVSGGGGGSPDSDVVEDDSNPFFEFWKGGSCTSEGDTPIQSPSPLTIDSKAKAFAEVQDYLAHKPLFSGDPFEWWRNEINATKYPLIKQLSVRYLSAPATSAECERMFSTAGIIVNDLRKKLTAENLEKLLFLHHNILILGF